MKTKFLYIIIFLFVGFQSIGQIAPNKYYIQFTDKSNSPYSIENPDEFLTQRALDRRSRQGIAIKENDIPVNPQYLTGVASFNVTLLNATKWLNGVTVETDDPANLVPINALPYVEDVLKMKELDNSWKKSTFDAELIVEANALKNTSNINQLDYGEAEFQINQINGIPLHDAGYRGQGMVIAVLDGGFEGVREHETYDSIWANNQVLGTKDFVNINGDVYTESQHGNSVLSTMAANTPGTMVGTAPKADYWLLRSEDVKSENVIEEYNWMSAAEFADSVGADVINSSLSYKGFNDTLLSHPYEDFDGNTAISSIAADLATSKGILVCNSAGNDGSKDSWWVGAPADADSILTVGSVTVESTYAAHSSRGPTSDGRIKPDVVALGAGTYRAFGVSNFFGPGSGTSFASPLIAGMSTCLWQANAEMNVMEIRAAIKQSASQSGNPDNSIGWGIPDYEVANEIMTTLENPVSTSGRLVEAWPNPFQNKLNITLDKKYAGNIRLRLVNANGAELAVQEINLSGGQNNIDLSALINAIPSGIYYLQVIANENVELVKLVKN